MLENKFNLIKDIFSNIFFSKKYDLFYIAENANWSTDWDGKYITKNLNNQNLIRAKVSSAHIGLRHKIIHFGSVNTLISEKGIRNIHPSNKTILTWFHISPTDKKIKYIPELNERVNLVHTSCNLTKEKLIGHGLNENKIVVIPLGVDLDVFKSFSKEKINEIKNKLNIPKDKIIIGSFQKDGNGWGEGLEPKMIKGPDIFCDVVEKLSQKFPLYVLLTGPARGYVKNRLNKAGINYTHKFLENYLDIVDYYNILDLYLVTSREEGGPKAILESMACGIPIISTRVGMAPDILTDNLSFLLSENPDNLNEKSEKIIADLKFKKELTETGLEKIKNYDWKIISKEYYNKLYKSNE